MDNKGQPRSRRKTIKTVEKTGNEEEIEKKRAAKSKPDEVDKEKQKAEEIKEEAIKQGIEPKEEQKAAETLALTDEEKAMLAQNTDEAKKRQIDHKEAAEKEYNETKEVQKETEHDKRIKELAKNDIPPDELEKERKKLEEEEQEILDKLEQKKKEENLIKNEAEKQKNGTTNITEKPIQDMAKANEDNENDEKNIDDGMIKRKQKMPKNELNNDEKKNPVSQNEEDRIKNEKDQENQKMKAGKGTAAVTAGAAGGMQLATKENEDKKSMPDDKKGDEEANKIDNKKEIPGDDEEMNMNEMEEGNINHDDVKDKHVAIDEKRNEEKLIPDTREEEKNEHLQKDKALKAVAVENKEKMEQEEEEKKLKSIVEEKQKKDAEIKKMKEGEQTKSGYLTAGLLTGASSVNKEFKPIIDENIEKNTENIGPGTNAQKYPVNPSSELGQARSNNEVFYEGYAWKKRMIFSCFWHERYFVLGNDGKLKYFRDLNGKSKKGLNIFEATDLVRVDELTKKQPYKIMLRYQDQDELLGFVEEGERDRWAAKLGECRRNLL